MRSYCVKGSRISNDTSTLFVIGIIAVAILAAITHVAEASSSFTFKITVKAVDATSEMGKMKVKVTVKDKAHPLSSDKGRTQSKTVDIGKQAQYWGDSEFVVAKFDFKNTHKGDWYIVCIANMCKDTEQIKSKSVLDVFSVGWAE